MTTPRKRGRTSSPGASPSSSSPLAASTPKRIRTSTHSQGAAEPPAAHVHHNAALSRQASPSDDELDLLSTLERTSDGQTSQDQTMARLEGAESRRQDADRLQSSAHPVAQGSSHHDAAPLLVHRGAMLQRLSGHLNSPDDLVGMDDQVALLRQTLQATVQRGESNSILLVGTKGSGKSAILNATLSSLGPRESYHHVYVSARQCTTDRAAMRELALQLIQSGAFNLHDAEGHLDINDEDEADGGNEVEEDVEWEGALDEEAEEERREALGNAVLSSLSSTTSSILALLASASASSSSTSSDSAKPLIISLDSFDLLTSRPRQALLYCLLDAVQSGTYRPGLAIVGMTRRVDTTDLLEKRVKSRFSHRIVQCYPPAGTEQWKQVVERVLLPCPPRRDLSEDVALQEADPFEKDWKREVTALLEDTEFTSLLDRITDHSKDVDYLFTVLYPPLAQLAPSPISSNGEAILPSHPFVLSHSTLQSDPTLSILYDLPSLPFLFLVAAKHLQTRDRNVFNFEIAFDEVCRFSRKSRRDREGAGTGGMGLKTMEDHHREEGEESMVDATPKKSSSARMGGKREAERGSAWEDRKRGMMAFDYLLSLDLFLPDAFLSTLSFGPTTTAGNSNGNSIVSTSGQAARSTLLRSGDKAASWMPSLTAVALRTGQNSSASSTVRREYLRVRSVVEPQVVLAVARERGKRGTIDSAVVQWTSRGG